MLHPLYLSLLVPAACAGFFALGRFPRLRQLWLLFCSGLFLFAAEPEHWWLLLTLTALAWLAPLAGKTGAAVYAGLAVGTLAAVKLSGQAWPVGLSFVALQGIAYAADAAGDAACRGSLPQVLHYTLFFPKLSAGPICRFAAFREEAQAARISWEDMEAGLIRLAFGLGKKLLIADSLYPLAMAGFTSGGHPLGWALSLGCCTLYVYFDFSGCTDIALGVGRMLGMRLPENFDRPLQASSLRAFWRRWHMSLSGFLRDYVYIPLGGSRRGRARTLINVLIVFVLMGLWHGFTWGYLLFGLWHGLLMLLEHSGILTPARWKAPFGRLYTLFTVAVGFVIFMAPGLPAYSPGAEPLRQTIMTLSPMAVIALAAAVFLLMQEGKKPLPVWAARWLALALLAVCWTHLLAGGYVPMLYAQF